MSRLKELLKEASSHLYHLKQGRCSYAIIRRTNKPRVIIAHLYTSLGNIHFPNSISHRGSEHREDNPDLVELLKLWPEGRRRICLALKGDPDA